MPDSNFSVSVRWVDAKVHAGRLYKGNGGGRRERAMNLRKVVELSGGSMEGRLHSGLHDTKNLSGAVGRKLRSGYEGWREE